MAGIMAPDDLSDWAMPPPAALGSGEGELLRVFDTAAEAMAFLARHGGSSGAPPRAPDGDVARARRHLAAGPVPSLR